MERLRPFYTWGMCLMEPYVAPPWVAHHNKVGRQYSRLLQKRAAVIKRPLSNSIRTSANKAQDGDLDRIRLILPKVPPSVVWEGRILSLTLDEQVLQFLCCWQVPTKRKVDLDRSPATVCYWAGRILSLTLEEQVLCFLCCWQVPIKRRSRPNLVNFAKSAAATVIWEGCCPFLIWYKFLLTIIADKIKLHMKDCKKQDNLIFWNSTL